MKKFILTSLFLLCQVLGYGQVNAYQFDQTNGTYTSISDGTLVASGSATETFDTEGWTENLPFAFNFNQQDYESVHIGSNGSLTFGGVGEGSTVISDASTSYQGAVAVMNRDLWAMFYTSATLTTGSTEITNVGSFEGLSIGTMLRSGSGIAVNTTVTAINEANNSITISIPATASSTSYSNNSIGWAIGKVYTKTIGTAPNRKFVVEWNNFSDYTTSASATNKFSFQVHLEETTNKIYFVYGDFSNTIYTSNRTNQIGLRGATNADYVNRMGTSSWTTTTAGTSNTSTVSRNITNFPAIGLTYIWSPPVCSAPSNVTISNILQNSATITWNAPTILPENGYMWEVRTDTNPGTAGAIHSGVTTSDVLSVDVSNLSVFTNYNVYLKTVCDDDTESVWSIATSFVTNLPLTELPFVDDFETISNSWGFVNGTQKNKWFIGEAVHNGGSKSLYISDHVEGLTHNYATSGTNATSRVSVIRDLHIPNDAENISISFDWIGNGEGSGNNYYDYLSVWLVPTTFTPQAGTNITESTERILLGRYKLNNIWLAESILFDSSDYLGENLRLVFEWRNDSSGGQQVPAAIDNLSITKVTCVDPANLISTQIYKNAINVSWTASSSPSILGYEYEVRTSGLPGTAAGLVSEATVGNVLVSSIENLQPSTTYTIYLRTKCSETNYSEWISYEFTTLCDYPDIIDIVNDTVCGVGSANLSANVEGNGIVEWYASPNAVQSLFTGTNFETPEINQTTSFYVGSAVVSDNAEVYIGEGSSTTSTFSNPFFSSWSNLHTQHIITAEELINFGLEAGDITAVGLNVTNAGTLPMLNFSLKVGTTTETALQNFIDNDAFVTVNTANSFMPVVGVNMISFDQPFNWDGVSNIVLEFCHHNPTSTSTMSRTVKSDATTYVSSIKTHIISSANSVGICDDTTTNRVTYSVRPQFIFEGRGLCRSPKQEVVVEVNPSEEVVLSSNATVEVCQGNNTATVNIVSGGENYDTYIWEPAEGVFGNAQDGFYFNIHENTVFTLKAINTTSDCRFDQQVVVNVTSMGYEPLDEIITNCGNEIIELDVTRELSIDSIVALDVLGHYSFDTLIDADWTHNNLTGTTTIAPMSTLSSEGNGYLRFSHVNTSTGNITFNGTFNGEDNNGLIIEFKHMAILEGNTADYGVVEYSLDNGATWVVMNPSQYVGAAQGLQAAGYKRFGRQSYTDWSSYTTTQIPEQTSWKQEKFVLLNTDQLDLSNVKFRFSLRADGSVLYYGWLLDDVKVSTIGEQDFQWESELPIYTDEEATQLYQGESISKVYVKPINSGTIPVTVTVTNGACTSIDVVDIYVPTIIVPDFSGEQYCEPVLVDEMTFVRSEDHTYEWFNSLYSQTTIDTISHTATYYVKITIDGCSSQRIAVPIYVVNNENVTTQTVQKFCDSATVADLVATGSHGLAEVKWYASADATTPLTMNTPLVHNTTYYVNQILFGCISNRIAVNVKIFDTPQPLVTNEIFVCNNSLVGNIVIDGNTNLKWYTSPTATSALFPNTVVTTGVYYIATNNDICESERLAVQINVVVDLPALQVNLINVCGSGVVSDLNNYVAGNLGVAEIRWFNSMTSQTPLPSNQNLTTGTYYVEQYLTGCSSVRRAVAVRVSSKVAPIINALVLCYNTKISDVHIPSPSEVTYKWYLNPNATQDLPSDYVLSTGTYYVKRVQYGCESNPTAVSVTILPVPSAPTGSAIQSLEQGSTIADVVMDQTNVVWYATQEDAQNGVNPLDVDMPLFDQTTYYAVLINANQCPSLPTSVKVELFLGINDLDTSVLKVYPNPTDSFVNITYKESIDVIEVYTMLGQRVIHQTVDHTDAQIDMSQLTSGTYMIKISLGNSSQLVKVVRK